MRILAIGAHYDDVELNAAGTLLRARAEGHEINLCVCTDGSKGGKMHDRKVEQQKVNKLMGYANQFDLHLQDGFLSNNFDLISRIEEVVNYILPDIVITTTEDDLHQDHVAVSKAVRAVNRFSKFSVITFPGQDPKQPFLANLYIDISKYFGKKMKIIQEYKTQITKPWFLDEVVNSRNVGIGGMKHSERFFIRFLKI